MPARPKKGISSFNPNVGSLAAQQMEMTQNTGSSIGANTSTHYYFPLDKTIGDANLGVRMLASASVQATTTNSANPPAKQGAHTTISTVFAGSCIGHLLGKTFTIVDANCSASTSSDSNVVSANCVVHVAGFEVVNEKPSFKDGPHWTDSYSIPFQQQTQTVEFPVFGPFACSGFVGLMGEAGVKANLNLTPIYAEADIQPYARAGVYGEVDAGLDVEVASAWGGLHADLTLVDDTFTLGANIGIVALPGNQIGWRDEAYLGNEVQALHGNLSLAVHVFGPGGVQLSNQLFPFYTVPGYSHTGRLVDVGGTHPLPWKVN
jgi:hypothetical protein